MEQENMVMSLIYYLHLARLKLVSRWYPWADSDLTTSPQFCSGGIVSMLGLVSMTGRGARDH